MNPPSKKLQDFCKEFNISWEQLDVVVMSADNVELDMLNTGTPLEKQVIVTKYTTNATVHSNY